MSLTQILVIEDDQPIREGICDALESARYSVVGAEDGESGLEQLDAALIDLVLLDIVLPGRDGLSVLSVIRERWPDLPVIMLTARGDVQDRIRGLNLGADDYVVKPFNVRELLARVEAVLRRSRERRDQAESTALPGGRTVNFQVRRITHSDGSSVELSEKEADLLRFLSSRPGRIVSRDELIRQVWQMNPRGIRTRTVDMHIARLREKLNGHNGGRSDSPNGHSEVIVTIRGQGYQFCDGSTEEGS